MSYDSSKIQKYPKAWNLFKKTLETWRINFKNMSNEQLQAFMEEIAEWSKAHR